MKTTEMIARVKEAQEYVIANQNGRAIRTDTLRDLGFVLYTVIENVQHGDVWKICTATNLNFGLPATLLIMVDDHQRSLDGAKVTYNGVDYGITASESLEFDSFGELENWSKVTEEEATLLLTKAPVEPPQEEPGVDLFKQVCDLLDLNYDDYVINDVNDEYAQLQHKKEDRYIDIMFNKGLVQVNNGMTAEPPRKLEISFATEPTKHGIDAFQVPDQRTGYEVKAS